MLWECCEEPLMLITMNIRMLSSNKKVHLLCHIKAQYRAVHAKSVEIFDYRHLSTICSSTVSRCELIAFPSLIGIPYKDTATLQYPTHSPAHSIKIRPNSVTGRLVRGKMAIITPKDRRPAFCQICVPRLVTIESFLRPINSAMPA